MISSASATTSEAVGPAQLSAESAVPQLVQNMEPSGTGLPHFVQNNAIVYLLPRPGV